jgi:hypothetical protein
VRLPRPVGLRSGRAAAMAGGPGATMAGQAWETPAETNGAACHCSGSQPEV